MNSSSRAWRSNHNFHPAPSLRCRANFPLKCLVRQFSGWKVIASIVRERRLLLHEAPRAQARKLVKQSRCPFRFPQNRNETLVRGRPGDRFQPLGMSMPKKLYEFMVDAKIPRSWRNHIPIVCSPRQIIWVVGWRIDDRVKPPNLAKKSCVWSLSGQSEIGRQGITFTPSYRGRSPIPA